MSKKITKEEFIERHLKLGIPFGRLVRERLFSLGIKQYKCECCGLTEWRGKPIQIQVHHINGNRNDNRLENLQVLCPNCHAQTENYQAKNTVVYAPRDKICINCGQVFHARGDYQKCCSRKCSNEYHRKTQRECKSPYTKEFMEKLCAEYNTLDEIGFVIHKTRDTVKRNLIQHGLFESFLRKRDFNTQPIVQYDLTGNLIKEWGSISDAAEVLHLSGSHISSVCKGERKTTGGFIWRYKEGNIAPAKIEIQNKWDNLKIKVLQYDRDGRFIQEFESISEAAKATSNSVAGIQNCLNGHNIHSKGFIWRYKKGNILPNIEVPKFHNERAKPIIQYDIQGNFIQEFPSINSAYKETGISCTAIKNCLTGVTKSIKDYIWKFK